MEELLNDIAERSKMVALTEGESEFLRARLVEYAARPRVGAAGELAAFWSRSWGRAAFALRSAARPVLAAAVIAAVLAGGAGVSYAAEGAVPGDALYGFKVAVNEEVVAALSVTPDAKARWETRRAERRLEEAETLVGAGRLDAAKAEVLESEISAHAAKAGEHLAEIDRDGRVREAAELGSELESALQGHAAVIGRLSERPEDEGAEGADHIIKAAEKQAGRTAERRSVSERAVAGPDNRRAADASLADAEKKLAAAREKFEEALPRLAGKTADQVGALIAKADGAIGSGRAALAGGKFNEAFSSFQEAARAARKAAMLISSEKKWPDRSSRLEPSRKQGANESAAGGRGGETGEQERVSGRETDEPGRDR